MLQQHPADGIKTFTKSILICMFAYRHVLGKLILAALSECQVCSFRSLEMLVTLRSYFSRLRNLLSCVATKWKSTYSVCFLTTLQQTTFEIIVAKGEIAHNEQFLHLLQCFQLSSIIKYIYIYISYIEIFHILSSMFSKSSAAELMYVGKG